MRVEICCIGHTTIDRVITPMETVTMPGGTSVYFSNAIAGFPVSFLLVTALAESDFSVLDPLKKRGVEALAFPSRQTLFFENSYGENPDERSQNVLQIADPFTTRQFEGITASVYHLGTLSAGDIPAATMKALAAKGRLSLDVQGCLRKVDNGSVVPTDWHEKEEVLPVVHYLKANEEEMVVLTGTADVEMGAKKLAAMGVKEVIITCGSKGSLLYYDNVFYNIPAFPPQQLRDATGCGDTYMAGYLYKRSKGAAMKEAGEFAAAMATLKLGVSGPFTGTEEDVNALLRAASKRA